MKEKDIWITKFKPCIYSDKLLGRIIAINATAPNKVDINIIKKAIYYTRKYHGSQLRASGDAYYSHPIEVAYLFIEYVGREDTQYYTTNLIVTAILHDIIEDTELTKDMIATIFNNEVANKVEDLTRIKLDRKITAREAVDILFAEHKNDVLYIKLFDRLHNIKTIKYKKPEKIKKIVEETLLCFLPLAAYLKVQSVEDELYELCLKTIKFD